MEATARPELTVIEDPLTGFDGELTPENLSLLAARVKDLDDTRRAQEADLAEREDEIKGLQGEIRSLASRMTKLKRDKEKKARASKAWPQAERIFAIWKAATGNRSKAGLSYKRFEFIEPFLRDADRAEIDYEPGPPRNALEECAAAVIGRAHDHFVTDRSNGTRKHHHGWELIFRDDGYMAESRDRRPADWRERLRRWDPEEHMQEHRPTHCHKGHEFTPENTYVTPAGLRQCRICKRERERLGRARRKAAA